MCRPAARTLTTQTSLHLREPALKSVFLHPMNSVLQFTILLGLKPQGFNSSHRKSVKKSRLVFHGFSLVETIGTNTRRIYQTLILLSGYKAEETDDICEYF